MLKSEVVFGYLGFFTYLCTRINQLNKYEMIMVAAIYIITFALYARVRLYNCWAT